MKYVIRNCPCAKWRIGQPNKIFCIESEEYDTLCKDIKNCIPKQIVKKCKNIECDCLIEKRKCGAMDSMSMCCDLWKSKDILSLLEIEEVND